MPKPRNTLTSMPGILAQWDRSKNQGIVPEECGVGSNKKVWWKCEAGHEWEEVVGTRTSDKLEWKKGKIDACPFCVGARVQVTCSKCGRGEVKRLTAGCKPPPKDWMCRTCYAAWRKENDEQIKTLADQWLREVVSKTCQEESIPEEVLLAFRREMLQPAIKAMAMQALQDHEPLDTLTLMLQAEARHAKGVIKKQVSMTNVCGRGVWVPSLRACVLGLAPGQTSLEAVGGIPAEPQVVTALREFLAQADIAQNLKQENTTREATWALTSMIRNWLDNIYDEVWGEVWMYGSNFTGKHGGRVDLLASSQDTPDLIVEIDSDHKANSITKLKWASQLGADVLWVRWRRGRINCPQEIPVIDLIKKSGA